MRDLSGRGNLRRTMGVVCYVIGFQLHKRWTVGSMYIEKETKPYFPTKTKHNYVHI